MLSHFFCTINSFVMGNTNCVSLYKASCVTAREQATECAASDGVVLSPVGASELELPYSWAKRCTETALESQEEKSCAQCEDWHV
jgi:hypothetical protein